MLMWLSCVAEYIAVDFLKINSCVVIKISFALILFFPMFPFEPPENIRKLKVFRGIKGFLMFSGESKASIGKKRVNSTHSLWFYLVLWVYNNTKNSWHFLFNIEIIRQYSTPLRFVECNLPFTKFLISNKKAWNICLILYKN